METISNKFLIKQLKLTVQLLELHNHNPFKIRGYQNAVFQLENAIAPIAGLDAENIQSTLNISKTMAEKLHGVLESGTLDLLEELLAETPEGVLEMLQIKGIGPKKIRLIWQELGIDNTKALSEACRSGRIASLKGFGQKTEQKILDALAFISRNKGRLFYAEAEPIVQSFLDAFRSRFPKIRIEIAGEFRRKMETVGHLIFLAAIEPNDQITEFLGNLDTLSHELEHSNPFIWRGAINGSGLNFECRFCPPERFVPEWFIQSSSDAHLFHKHRDSTLYAVAKSGNFQSEAEIYEKNELPFIEPELREGTFEFSEELPELIRIEDLKGSLHNHSTYSDGANTLEEMALYCRDELGLEYLGICDHSQSAFYASGLKPETVLRQHEEIDRLNNKLAPFKILKGIESDILTDGSLDYEEDILKRFDFVVASVHSGLQMDEKKATDRLLRAITNPYTTILGHMTGRILLRREGYPVNHKQIIDACVKHNVVIEINANPHRLDIDWRWVHYALKKGAMLSINPDAHETQGLRDMKYGVYTGRKGGLTKNRNLNSLSLQEIESFFQSKKS